MNHETLPLWGLDVFAKQPLTGRQAIIVGTGASLTASQRDRVLGALPDLPVGILHEAGDPVELATDTASDAGSGHLGLAAISTLDHPPPAIVSGGRQYQVTTVVGAPAIELEPPAASVDPIDDVFDEALAGASRGTLAVGDDALPPAVVTLGQRWIVVPLAYFSDVSSVSSDLSHDLCRRYDAVGLCAMTFDTVTPGATVHLRTVTTAESAAPTLAAGSVGAYLRQYGAIDGSEVAIAAGLETPPRRIDVGLGPTLAVGGPTTTYLTGDLVVPDDEPDDTDIIEL